MLCVTLTGISKEVMVKTKGMYLHIWNNHAADWHQVHVCGNRWSGLGWSVKHTKYHLLLKRHAENLGLGLQWVHGQNERYVAHLKLLCNWLAQSMGKDVKRFELSLPCKVPPIIPKAGRQLRVVVTLTWNEGSRSK